MDLHGWATNGHNAIASRCGQRASVLQNASSASIIKGGDTKIELGFSMTLAGAIPGIHPEGRRLGALRLGRRLETPKSQVWFLPITGELRPVMGFTTFYERRTRPLANTS